MEGAERPVRELRTLFDMLHLPLLSFGASASKTIAAFPLPCASLNAPVLLAPVTVNVALMVNLNRHAAASTRVGGVLLLASGA